MKRTKLLKNGNAPLFIRISSFPDMVEISLKCNIKPELWDTAKSKAKGNSDEAKELNEFINNIRVQLFQIQQDLLASGKKITVKTLANTFLGVGEKNWTLAELFEEHNSNLNQLIGKDFFPLTLQWYK